MFGKSPFAEILREARTILSLLGEGIGELLERGMTS